MDLLRMLTGAGDNAAIGQIAQRFGVDPAQAQQALESLLPAVTQGLHHSASEEGGLGSLLSSLATGAHTQYVDDPSAAASDQAVSDGNSVLGQIFGSKDASRAVANQAAQQSGLSPDLLKGMLPVVASMAMGALSKHQASVGDSSGGGLQAILGSLVGQNPAGGALGGLLGVAEKFFQK